MSGKTNFNSTKKKKVSFIKQWQCSDINLKGKFYAPCLRIIFTRRCMLAEYNYKKGKKKKKATGDFGFTAAYLKPRFSKTN